MNRRAALAGALTLAIPVGATTAASAAPAKIVWPKAGQALVGAKAFRNRVIDPGRLMSIADYCRENDVHGIHPEGVVIHGCEIVNCTNFDEIVTR